MINSFKDYIKVIVQRYSTSPAILGWEVANDPRCESTLPTSGICNPHTVTQWTAELAQYVKQQDPNHLVSSGDSGFYCVDCPKLFPFVPPPPAASPAPGKRRASGPLTRGKLLAKDSAWKKRNLPGFQKKSKAGGRSIRGGKWFAPVDAGAYYVRLGTHLNDN
jgi:mannan endo-1,4-beta-mannosidase